MTHRTNNAITSTHDVGALSPVAVARILGAIGLAGIATGAFDIGYVHNKLIVAGNISATLQNIRAHETLFRLGFSAHLFEMVLNIGGEILFFYLFRRVNKIVAALALCSGVNGIAVESFSLVAAYLPLHLAVNGSGGGPLNQEQVQSFAHVCGLLQETGLLLSFAFYGLDELLSGLLIFRSGFVPRFIGILLSISGFCYLSNTFLQILAPVLDARMNPYILYACFPGEFLSSLWLATVGLSLAEWAKWTTKPAPEALFA